VWEEARKEYGAITVPTLLVYGDHDWSRPHEREANLNAIPGATMETVENGGHFLSVDRPEELVAAIRRFAGGAAEPRAKTA
jgi:pimeloyl-ACP methyl ester carboxylesterase